MTQIKLPLTDEAGLDEFHEAMKQDFYDSLGVAQILPVITLYQPWATWIMREWKTIETRTHNMFRSLLGKKILLHAGLTTDASAINNPYLTKEQLIYNPDEMVNGFILGSAFVHHTGVLGPKDSKDALIDCANTTRYGLFLNNIEKWDVPVKEKGEMGIWYYDVTNMKKVTKSNL